MGQTKTLQLIVFDLDFTLWDCGGLWCDCLTPPFRLEQGRVLDAVDRHVRLYDDVREILTACIDAGIPLALASRTQEPAWARQLVALLGITDCFDYDEIYPSSKLKHFAALRDASSYEYDQMLFFDDEQRNIDEVSQLGVACVHVSNGINWDIFRNSCQQFEGIDL